MAASVTELVDNNKLFVSGYLRKICHYHQPMEIIGLISDFSIVCDSWYTRFSDGGNGLAIQDKALHVTITSKSGRSSYGCLVIEPNTYYSWQLKMVSNCSRKIYIGIIGDCSQMLFSRSVRVEPWNEATDRACLLCSDGTLYGNCKIKSRINDMQPLETKSFVKVVLDSKTKPSKLYFIVNGNKVLTHEGLNQCAYRFYIGIVRGKNSVVEFA